jgi:hypothetical protein
MKSAAIRAKASDFHDDADVTHVSFTFNEDDLARWKEFADFLKEKQVDCLKTTDYRCRFECETDEGFVQSSFRSECDSVEVHNWAFGKPYICFTGYEKHDETGKEWSTERIYLHELQQALDESDDHTAQQEVVDHAI